LLTIIEVRTVLVSTTATAKELCRFAGVFLFEEVLAFKQHLHTFCSKFVKMGYCVRAFQLDAKIWLDWSRPRTASLIVWAGLLLFS
jgi:hypothetical protein